jgi:Ca2+-binding EF-hand superfamily protein
MDRDFDGRLSFAEIMGEETPIEKLFKLMDKNGDGFVSKKVSCIDLFHIIVTSVIG